MERRGENHDGNCGLGNLGNVSQVAGLHLGFFLRRREK